MVKNTQKKTTTKKEKVPQKAISKAEIREVARSKLCKGEGKTKMKGVNYYQIKELLNEQTFQCQICLQTLLKPALAECGHIFCLPCIEDLVKHNYPCGICHDLEPTYDITINNAFQKLVNIYLSNCSLEQWLIYQKRQKVLQESEASRCIGKLSVNDFVDYWCAQQKCWKVAFVKDISRSGTVLLAESKGCKEVEINILSRRLAKYRYYTKEEVVVIDQVNNSGGQIINRFNRGFPHPAPPMYHNMGGMPFFINIFGDPQPNFGVGGFDGNDYFGFMPGFRPFSFQ